MKGSPVSRDLNRRLTFCHGSTGLKRSINNIFPHNCFDCIRDFNPCRMKALVPVDKSDCVLLLRVVYKCLG